MDEQKNSQDLTVGLDGEMTEGITSAPVKETVDEQIELQNKSASQPPTEPQINTVLPPPVDEAVTLPEQNAGTPIENDEQSGVVKAPDETAMPTQNTSPTSQSAQPVGSQMLEDSNSNSSATSPDQSQSQDSSLSKNSHKVREHRNNKKLAVIMVLFVALVLSGVAVFIYVAAQDNASPEQPVIEPVTEAQTVSPAEDTTTDSNPDEIIEQPIIDPDNPIIEGEATENSDEPVDSPASTEPRDPSSQPVAQ